MRSVLTAVLAAAPLVAQFSGSFVLPVEDEALGYSKPADDPVARLQAKLERGDAKLSYSPAQGYLLSVLKELNIPVESQVLVFSKTSFQQSLIAPWTPRALYFNDDVYMGFVQNGEVLEVASVDPTKGAIFYTMDQRKSVKPKFVRHDECLQCHASPRTLGIPGHMVRSVYPDAEGFPQLQAGSFTTTHASPMKERWGGWFVTGTHGSQRHMGNVWIKDKNNPEKLDMETGANRMSLKGIVDLTPYASQHSDIVALMVLEHQYHVHNLITRVAYETRLALSQQEGINKALGRPLDEWSDSTKRRIFGGSELLVKNLLFTDEALLEASVKGSSEFTRMFAERGPRDSKGRSVRQFDLTRRLFKYPVSFIVYTEAFDSLPLQVKDYVYRRLHEVLTAQTLEKDYTSLANVDRPAMLEILRETKPEFDAFVRTREAKLTLGASR